MCGTLMTANVDLLAHVTDSGHVHLLSIGIKIDANVFVLACPLTSIVPLRQYTGMKFNANVFIMHHDRMFS